jgi:ribosomal protein L11 methyltransferase
MKWIETKITLDCEEATLAVDLVADIFHTLGARGVVVDDPLLEPAEEWGENALPRPATPAVTGYLPDDERLKGCRWILEKKLAEVAQHLAMTFSIATAAVDEKDWAEAWKAFFWPEEITPGIVVKPTWRDYTPKAGQLVIEIDPGMAFGTGTHPTTALCIRLIEKHLRANQAVLDVGTGSGILLIAAAKLGAATLTGIDLDPLAIEIARENLTLNQVDPGAITLKCADLVDSVPLSFDLVVANILAEVILDLLEDVGRVLKPGGILICSGIIEAHQRRVADKMAANGFVFLDIEKEGDWVAFAGRSATSAGSCGPPARP